MPKKKPLEISNKEYRQMEGLSSTDIKTMSKSFALWKYRHDNPEDNNDNPALLFGRASHKLMLEPFDFDNEFVVAPKVDKRTKAGKEEWAKFCEENKDKDVIDQATYETLYEMQKALYSTKFCKKLLDGEHEKSFFYTDKEFDLVCKCRPDSYSIIGNNIICTDYKTTQSAEPRAFMNDCMKYGYDIQASHYLKGLKDFYGGEYDYSFVFVAQEKTPPYNCAVYQADDYFLKLGEETRKALLETYKLCVEKNEYPAYMGFADEAEIMSLSIPEYLKKEILVDSEEGDLE